MRKRMSFIWVLAAFFIAFAPYSHVYGYSGQTVSEQQNQSEITVDPKVIKKQTDLVSIDISIPVISGLSDKAFQMKLNESIKKQAQKAKSTISRSAKKEAKRAEQEGRNFIPFDLTISYQVENKEDILSFYITTYQFTGGAHGVTYTTYYNIDLDKNQNITLADLFKPDSNYKEVINAEINKQIQQQEAAEEGTYFSPEDPYVGDSAFQSIKDDQPFYIQDGNLVIAFAQYEIAPGYMGEPVFSIPLQSLKELLADDYQKLVAEEN